MSVGSFSGLLPVAKRVGGDELRRKTKRIVIPSSLDEGSVTFVFEPPRVVPPKVVVKKSFFLVPVAPSLLELLPQGIILTPGWLYIGRGPELELPVFRSLVVRVEGISKQHAAVTEFNEKPFVTDLGSTNGTRIFRNNQPIEVKEEPVELLAGDILWLGAVYFEVVRS